MLITADEWRGGRLGFRGHPAVVTPNLDRLAGEGTTFTRHYAQTVPCGPSRASLHTGLYLHQHRAVTNGSPMRARTNMALEARKVGYSPTLFGYTDTSLLAGRDELGADDLGSYESVLPGYDSGHGAKPEPDGLLACAAAYGAGPDQLVMVGDTATDMEAAARAGCTSVLLAPHGQPVGGPDHVVSTLAEVGLLFGGRPGSAQA